MAQIPTMEEALTCAVETAKEQPGQVPEAPAGWIEQAQAALDSEDEAQVAACAETIVRAHSQYKADFDVKGWLFDLRQAARVTS